MKQSPLNLNHYQLLDLAIKPDDDYQPPDESFYPDMSGADLSYNIQLGEAKDDSDNKDFAIKLSLMLKPKTKGSYPYNISLGIEGFITVLFDQSGANYDRSDFVIVNGAALLYGAARELLLTTTHHFEKGPIMLPTVTFIDHLEKQQPPIRQTLKKKSAPKKKATKRKS